MLSAKVAWDWSPSDPNMQFDHFEVWDADLANNVLGTAPRSDGSNITATPTDASPLVLNYPTPGGKAIAVFVVDTAAQKSDPSFLSFTLSLPRPNPVTNLRFIGQ